MMENKYKSRKFGIFIALEVLSTSLLLFGFIDSSQWVNMTQWAFGIYAAGNIGEHFTNKPVTNKGS